MESEWLTPGEIAKLAGLGPDAVRNWERRGLLKATRTPSGRRLFRRRDVERFLAEREAKRRARDLVPA